MFSVTDENGNEATYTGRIVKFATPQEKDFQAIASEHILSVSLELSAGYQFYTTGVYQVTLKSSALTRDGVTIDLQSNTVSFTVVQPDERASPRETRDSVTFTGCSSDEISEIMLAGNNAIIMVQTALTYLNHADVDTPACVSDFEEWFGLYTPSHWETITSDYNAILALLESQRYGIDCTCTDEDIFAYVYRDDSDHVIHLCGYFWMGSVELYNEDSKPGTLIHEASHFSDIANTDDNAYGTSNCRELAQADPVAAVNNADSHEYFTEFEPLLSDICTVGDGGDDGDDGGDDGDNGGDDSDVVPIQCSPHSNTNPHGHNAPGSTPHREQGPCAN